MKKIALILIALILPLLLVFFYLYQFTGLKYFIKIADEINKYSEPAKTQAINGFYGDKNDTKRYTGILAGVNRKGLGGVWVWGRLGLLYFPAGINSEFSFTDGCSNSLPISSSSIIGIIDTREKFTDIQQWGEKIRTGDSVFIDSKSDIGLLNGKFDYVSVYNFRLFLKADKITCEK